MRIEKVTFKNLNSLAGTWRIDFTDERYVQDGIFAITGPTGAGKSTVLDAICLALYGQTPRLNTISKSSNEIMTRQTGDCFAEVVFSTAKGRFRSHWSQRRARNKADGALQAAKQELVNLDTNEIVNLKKGITDKISELTGLDFKRFTRSMLLAQGDFAAFLKATSDERASILEKITGMEIYAEISAKVYRRSDEERKKLEALQAKMGDIEILPDSEREQKEAARDALVREEAELLKSHQQTRDCLAWLQNIAALKNGQADLQKSLDQCDNDILAFEPSLRQLHRASDAAKADSAYGNLSAYRQTLQNVNEKLHEAKRQEPALLKASKEAEDLTAAKKALWDKAVEVQKTEAPTIAKVRLMDAGIKTKEDDLALSQKAIDSLNHTLSESRKDLDVKKQERQKLEAELQTLELFLKDHANDRELLQSFSGFESTVRHIVELDTDIRKSQSRLGKEEKRREDAQKKFNEGKAFIAQKQNELARMDERIITITQELASLLKGETEISLSSRLDALKEQRHYRQLIQKLEDHRKELKDGEACPLCGALDHPYALGNVPLVDEVQKQIDSLAGLLSQVKETQNSLNQQKETASAQRLLIADLQTKSLAISKEIELIDEQIRNAKTELSEKYAKRNTEIEAFYESVTGFGISKSMALSEAISNLRQRKTQWTETETSYGQKSTVLQQLCSKIRETEALLAEKEKVLNEKSVEFDQLQKSLSEDRQERFSLFGQKDPVIEAARQQNDIDTAKQVFDNAQSAAQTKREAYREVCSAIQTYQSQIQDLNTQVLESEKLFAEKLKEGCFTSEKEYLDNRLPSEQIQALQNKEKALSDRKSRLVGQMDENSKALEGELNRQLTEKTNEELQVQLADITARQNTLRQTLSDLQVHLKNDDLAREKVKGFRKEYETQQTVVDHWSALSELIGSADGKKFRNYAQGITFETMIAHANQALMKMSDRYLLLRSEDDGLQLQVQDNYQAGAIRSTKNLSGGESFIVSLALALGLSKMASRNVQVESLFLDEGFGTLDEEALDNALKTLAGLHRQGKLIGVISHVQALKDRIGTQIAVTPKSLGRSTISGPGVTALD